MLPFAEEAVFGGKLLRAAGDTEHAMSAAARAGSEIDASLNFAANQGIGLVGEGGRNAVVIGENMQRVRDATNAIGADDYHGFPGYKHVVTTFREAWLHNRG